ncbi:MAG: GIY-YIG nuclease family protein [Candidatus Magasanikbacteria bacterium]|nr:GIY-YIG nuclease family protein [Candidatus Magasanikbacteria bacterium]
MSKQYYVYILASQKNGTLYTGVTNDIIRSFEHKSKVIKGFTKKHGIHILVYYEVYDDVSNAISREKCIKRWKRNWKLRLIEENNSQWKDLYNELIPF